MSDLGWYVLQVHPRMEPLARDRIAELEREVFLPLVAERDAGRRQARVEVQVQALRLETAV